MELIKNIYTPDSILGDKGSYVTTTILKRPRWATCTSTCWLASDIVASLNLYGNKIRTYLFNSETNDIIPFQVVGNSDGATLSMSEHFSISPCGKLIAVCSAAPMDKPTPKAGVSIYRFNTETKLINPIPIFSIEEDNLIHNVRFFPDGKYLTYVSYNDDRTINIYRISDNGINFTLTLVQEKKNDFIPKKIKAINFTKDNKFAIISYCISLVKLQEPIESCIVCHEVTGDGKMGNIVSIFNDKYGMEDLVFSKDEDFIFASDQANDLIVKYSFNNKSGEIKYVGNYNPDNSLSFPHGISISKDGRYLAASSYGDDKFSIYKI